MSAFQGGCEPDPSGTGIVSGAFRSIGAETQNAIIFRRFRCLQQPEKTTGLSARHGLAVRDRTARLADERHHGQHTQISIDLHRCEHGRQIAGMVQSNCWSGCGALKVNGDRIVRDRHRLSDLIFSTKQCAKAESLAQRQIGGSGEISPQMRIVHPDEFAVDAGEAFERAAHAVSRADDDRAVCCSG